MRKTCRYRRVWLAFLWIGVDIAAAWDAVPFVFNFPNLGAIVVMTSNRSASCSAPDERLASAFKGTLIERRHLSSYADIRQG